MIQRRHILGATGGAGREAADGAMTPAELAALAARERATWERIVRVANIKAD